MPMPLSATASSIQSRPSATLFTRSATSPPFVNLQALLKRLSRICLSLCSFPDLRSGQPIDASARMGSDRVEQANPACAAQHPHTGHPVVLHRRLLRDDEFHLWGHYQSEPPSRPLMKRSQQGAAMPMFMLPRAVV